MSGLRILSLAVVCGLVASTTHAQPRQRGSIQVGTGYIATPNLYNENGDALDTGSDFSVLTTELGAEVVVANRAAFDAFVGGAIHLARVTLDDSTSGFAPQNVVLRGRLLNDRFGASVGVFIDVGQNPEDVTPPNSDGQHAILLGASVVIPSGRTLRLTTGANAHLTFARSVSSSPSVSIDDGDVFEVYLDGKYPLGSLSLGLRLQYVTITDITRTTDGAGEIFPDSDSYQLALIPSITVHPRGTPIHATLQLGARSGAVQEYADYGVALVGKNVAATRLPVALRLGFDF